jgi:hypothetical protein
VKSLLYVSACLFVCAHAVFLCAAAAAVCDVVLLNDGSLRLYGVTVAGSSCTPPDSLEPGESFTCTVSVLAPRAHGFCCMPPLHRQVQSPPAMLMQAARSLSQQLDDSG